MNNSNGITIVVPILNRANYLPRFLLSLQKIDANGLKVILVDNGSTDNSMKICEKFAVESTLDVTITRERKKGANAARNKGLQLCQTPYIYFFDSDDVLSKDFIKDLLPHMGNHDALFFPNYQIVNGKKSVRSYLSKPTLEGQILCGMFNTQSIVWNTNFLRKIDGWNEALSVWQDWELGVRLMMSNPDIVCLTDKVYNEIYVHEDSITGKSLSDNLEGRIAAMEQVGEKTMSDRKAKTALYYRACILEGMLKREKQEVAISRKFESSDFGAMTHFWGKGLRSYVALGGRGAWIFALKVVK